MVACPFSRGSSQPRDQILVSCLVGGFFTWASREALEKTTPSLCFVVRFKMSRWKVPNIGMTQWARAVIFVTCCFFSLLREKGRWCLLGMFEFRHFIYQWRFIQKWQSSLVSAYRPPNPACVHFVFCCESLWGGGRGRGSYGEACVRDLVRACCMADAVLRLDKNCLDLALSSPLWGRYCYILL